MSKCIIVAGPFSQVAYEQFQFARNENVVIHTFAVLLATPNMHPEQQRLIAMLCVFVQRKAIPKDKRLTMGHCSRLSAASLSAEKLD